MIPANIDYIGILNDLNRWGMTDYKVGLMCGFDSRYLAHLRAGQYRDMTYQRAARLYNLWREEGESRKVGENNPHLALST